MIYISSACVRAKTIAESIHQINDLGFKYIELSGGTSPYPTLINDLKELKERGNQFLLHNYFPPPANPFVLNLASLDDETARLSLVHAQKALKLGSQLGCERFGVHAGFRINIPVNQIGKSIDRTKLFDRDKALERFVENIKTLQNENDVKVYIENNVIASFNLDNFNGQNPFFLTSAVDYFEMAEHFELNLLLDVAHLKVSCQALNLNFDTELDALMPLSEYIHISDNDGMSDSNMRLREGSPLYNSLKRFDLSNKTITVEVYECDEAIQETNNAILSLL
jgi:sugar phosphate isomerase/epimerase